MKSFKEIAEEIRKTMAEDTTDDKQEKPMWRSMSEDKELAKARIYQNDGEESNCSGSTTSSTPGV